MTTPQGPAAKLTLDSAEQRASAADWAGRNRPRPLGSLVASARRLTSTTLARQAGSAKDWQEDAWEMFDLVGEERFLAATLAGRLSQAKLYVGTLGQDETEVPEPVENNTRVTSVLSAIGNSAAARQQLLNRLGVNLFVAGDGWVVGIPHQLLPDSMKSPADKALPDLVDGETLSIQDLDWRMLSVSEVKTNAANQVTIDLGPSTEEQIRCSPDQLYLIRVWRPHPRRQWEADSPTRSSLPVLRELVGLTMHISAQVDSRLAGAGLLIVPQSAQRALRIAAGLGDDDAGQDVFTDALIEAMLKPIENRANASALVPLVVTVPDDVTEKFNFITFAKPLDTEARNLRDEAIRRLALGQDAPPELLLGTSGMNHWGAWLVREDVVTTHIEPPLALICDALTTQYLWPVLEAGGMVAAEAHKYVIWYDVSHMVVRPNLSTDALTLHERGVLSDEALRAATGFDESDAPFVEAALPPEVTLALELVKGAPGLSANPGIPALVAQIRAVLAGDIPEVKDPVAGALPPGQAPSGKAEDVSGDAGPLPSTSGEPPVLPGMTGQIATWPGPKLVGINGH